MIMSEIFEIRNGSFFAKIAQLGAELVYLGNGKQNVLWAKETAHWNRISPILFPFVGRLKDDTYRYKGKEFLMKQHGFARNKYFQLVKQTDDAIELRLQNSNETKAIFPFEFDFIVKYSITESNVIRTQFIISNSGNDVLYFSVGGHPAFRLDAALESYSLRFHESGLHEHSVLQDGNFTGDKISYDLSVPLKLEKSLFIVDAVVFKKAEFNKVTMMKNSIPFLEMKGNWSSFGIWTKPNAPFLCIEPWWGYADDSSSDKELTRKPGMSILQPGQSDQFFYEIKTF